MQLIRAFSSATSIEIGSMSEAMARAVGQSCMRGEGEQAGAGADIGDVGEARAGRLQPVEREQAAGGGLVLAGAEGAAGVDLEGDGAGGDRRRDAPACARRSARRGSARARPGRASPSPVRPAPRPCGAAPPRARREAQQQGDVVGPRLALRNRRPSASRSAVPDPARWSSAPAASRARRAGRCPRSAPRPRPWCRAG